MGVVITPASKGTWEEEVAKEVNRVGTLLEWGDTIAVEVDTATVIKDMAIDLTCQGSRYA